MATSSRKTPAKSRSLIRTGIAVVTLLVAGVVKSLTDQGAVEPDKEGSPAPPAAEQQQQPDRIPAYETGKINARKGEEIIVTGKVANTFVSNSSGHHFLNFNSAKLRVICFKEDLGAFPSGGPAAVYKGKSVEVQGVVDLYKGNPQIRIQKSDQVRLTGADAKSTSAVNFALKQTGKDTWESPAGLRYAGRDPQGKTRLEHVLRHTKDIPSRTGSHGVFTVKGKDDAFKLIDEAWLLGKKKGIRPDSQGDSFAYTIPMGRKIGYLGGRTGASRRNPALSKVLIVIKRGTKNVITAYPK